MTVTTINDLSSPETFARTIFREQAGLLAVFSGSRLEGGKIPSPITRFFPYPAQLAEAADVIQNENASGKEVYLAGTLFTAATRKKEYAAPFVSLYADLDGARVPDHFPPPSVLVESSPGRQQAWWNLSEPMPPTDGEILNHRLTYALAADKSGWDLTQLLRIPGTTNHKYAAAQVRVIDADPSRVYTPADFTDLPPVSLIATGPADPMPDDWEDGAAVRARHRSRLSPELLYRLDTPPSERSGSLYRVYHLCRDDGLDQYETFSLVQGTRVDKFYQDNRPPRDLWQDVCRSFDKLGGDATIDPLSSDYVPRFAGYRRSELRTIPPARFLVDGFLLDNAITGISGKEGTSKSFLAQSLACCVVTGSPWYGHAVKRQGPVVYIAAEGAEGINKRVRAWELTNGVATGDDLIVIGQGPDFQQGGDVSDLLSDITHFLQGRQPVLIVVDTFAQTNSGEENSNSDGAAYTRACDRLRRETGAAILFLHHDSDNGKAFRGASGVRGNIHATVHVTKNEAGFITAQGNKLKDFGLPDNFRFRQVIVRDADDSPFLEDGDDRSSVVLESVSGNIRDFPKGGKDRGVLLRILAESCPIGLYRAEWERQAKAEGVSESGFDRAYRSLTGADGTPATVQSYHDGTYTRWRLVPSDGVNRVDTISELKTA